MFSNFWSLIPDPFLWICFQEILHPEIGPEESESTQVCLKTVIPFIDITCKYLIFL